MQFLFCFDLRIDCVSIAKPGENFPYKTVSNPCHHTYLTFLGIFLSLLGHSPWQSDRHSHRRTYLPGRRRCQLLESIPGSPFQRNHHKRAGYHPTPRTKKSYSRSCKLDSNSLVVQNWSRSVQKTRSVAVLCRVFQTTLPLRTKRRRKIWIDRGR